MLMLFAWVSILPIPTFPGGRLLIARMGMFEARSSSTQTLIFVTVLFCAYVFGVFETFSLWFLIFALLLPLLFFFGNDLRIPLILDETTGRRHRAFLILASAASPPSPGCRTRLLPDHARGAHQAVSLSSHQTSGTPSVPAPAHSHRPFQREPPERSVSPLHPSW